MDPGKALDFVRDNHRAVLATTRADGRAQLSPVTVGVDDDGHVTVSSRETAFKVKNVRTDPRVALCVMNDRFFGEWISIEGRATVIPLPEAMDGLVEYYRRISGEHPDWDDYRNAMVRDKRVLLLIDVERAGPDTHG